MSMNRFKFFQKNTLPEVDLEMISREVRRIARTPEFIPAGFVPIPFAENDIIAEGWDAHRNNQSPGQCPYDIGTRERELWLTGWSGREDGEPREPNPIEVPIRDVAVICTSLMDFTNWKQGLFADRWLEGDLEHRFVRNNNRYIAVMSIDSVRGRRFDDVVHTALANRRRGEDEEYNYIVETAERRIRR